MYGCVTSLSVRSSPGELLQRLPGDGAIEPSVRAGASADSSALRQASRKRVDDSVRYATLHAEGLLSPCDSVETFLSKQGACASGMLLTDFRSAMAKIVAERRSWSRDVIARGKAGRSLKFCMRGQSRQEFWLLAVLTRTSGTTRLSELKHGPCTLQPLTLIYTRTISASLIYSTYEDQYK